MNLRASATATGRAVNRRTGIELAASQSDAYWVPEIVGRERHTTHHRPLCRDSISYVDTDAVLVELSYNTTVTRSRNDGLVL